MLKRIAGGFILLLGVVGSLAAQQPEIDKLKQRLDEIPKQQERLRTEERQLRDELDRLLEYQNDRLLAEFIGTLRFDEKASLYQVVMKHNGRKEWEQTIWIWKNAPTRELDGFEAAAIRRLLAGEDVATEETLNRIRMVGAVRANVACLECHNVQRGQLLGAFTYELLRDPLAKEK